jgi:hypothetical protein
MAKAPRKNAVLANPFYLGLVLVSTLFVATCLAYYVSSLILEPAQGGQRASSRELAAWLDRHGPLALGIEFSVMLVAAVLAMLTDDWFSRADGKGG